ncbi:MAG: serine protease [Paracoccaceae bacterium]|nr:serine protease [Paracoccaceae bacterium]
MKNTDDEKSSSQAPVTAALEHLTGPSRGRIGWLSAPRLDVILGKDRLLRLRPLDQPAPEGTVVASIEAEGQDFLLACAEGCKLWINGKPVTRQRLLHGDVIEFGETGPISRFRLFNDHHSPHWTIDEIVGDSIAYLRSSRRPLAPRVTHAAGDLGHRLIHETTIFFRIGVIITFAVLGWLLYNQYQITQQMGAQIERGSAQLERVSSALAKSRAEALRPGDLAALREELGQRMTSSVARLEALEQRFGATARVIAQSVPAIAFLQGSYGLRHRETGQMLRHVMSDEGVPVITPWGQPLLSLTGDGPVAEVQFTGTAFLVGETGRLVTNRHVAMPWESAGTPQQLEGDMMEPAVLRFIAYFPGRAEPVDLRIVHASDSSDLALLEVDAPSVQLAGLTLADQGATAGDEVIVMGYPTGLRSLLAQSGVAFLEELEDAGEVDFWRVAERLAEVGMIAPLASRGIVGQVAPEAVVYDAETTHGGSGGPVLDSDGRVIAINSAILPEFGGSNLGIPVTRLRELLDTAAEK